jgi:hypothetical protein
VAAQPATATVARLGAADCEALSDGLLAQPVAGLSSLAFVAAAGWLLHRRPATGRGAAAGYAAVVGLVGLGSLAYHGPQGPASQVLHDAPVAAVLVVGSAVPLLRRARGDVALRRDRWRVVGVAGLAAAGGLAAYLLGRTGGLLCSPESVLQPHAAWHVLAAGALAAWGAALWPAGPLPPTVPRPLG